MFLMPALLRYGREAIPYNCNTVRGGGEWGNLLFDILIYLFFN